MQKKINKYILFFIFIVLVLVACEEPPSKEIIINDKPIKVYYSSFVIMCDTELEIGFAMASTSLVDKALKPDTPIGMLTEEQYLKFCGGD